MRTILSESAALRGLLRRTWRPSLLDPVVVGDPWMTASSLAGLLVLDVGNYPIALQSGTPLEQAAFNALIFRLRHISANAAPRVTG